MGVAEIFVEGDKLQVRDAYGRIVVPSANDIYAYKFENSDGLGELGPVFENKDVSCLEFSRFPLEPKVRIESDTTGALKCLPIGVHEGREYRIPNLLLRTADHIVIEKRWIPILRDSTDNLQKLLSTLGISCPGPLTLRQYLGLTAHPDGEFLVIRDLPGGMASPIQTADALAEAVPSSLVATLYPYQMTGFRWLSAISREEMGCILADEMGLGKTIQIIALIAREKESGSPQSLVLAPATILENWKREFGKFAPSLSVLVHRGTQRSGMPSELKVHDVVITSYETAVRDLPMLKLISWNLLILDEAQAIKNAETRRALAIKKLPKRVGISVTGTPVENRLADLWSIMDFSLPGYLGDLKSFQESFEGSIERAVLLEPRISPLLLRRRVREVAQDLPERIDIPQPLELSDEGARRYEEIRAQIEQEYGEAASLVALGKLRMYCSHPLLLDERIADPLEESPKYQRLVEILEEVFANGQKALVFTAFNKMIDIIVGDVGQRFSVFADFIDGRVASVDRQPVVDRFSEYAGPGVLVLNPRTGGTGLNITAANHVIHYTVEWNPAVEDQASARSYRRGQRLPVTVHRLFYINTVEEVIDDRISAKRELAAAAVVGTTGAEIDKDEILRALHISPVRALSKATL